MQALRVSLERVEPREEAFARGVLVEVGELERLEHPLLAAGPRRPEELLVDERDDRVARLVEIDLRDAELGASTVHVLEERRDAALHDLGGREARCLGELRADGEHLSAGPVHLVDHRLLVADSTA